MAQDIQSTVGPGSGAGPGNPPPCSHCGLPVPRALYREGDEHQFCCNGCRTVFEVIREHGLDRFYSYARGEEAPAAPARVSGRRFEEFDDPAFHDLHVRVLPDGRRTADLYLEGVHCAACVWLVEKVPVVLDGVAEARLDLRRSMATVTWDPASATLSGIARFLDSLGYVPHPFRGVELREMRRREDRDLLVRLGVAGFSAGNVMVASFALYGGFFHGMEAGFAALLRWASLLLALPAVLYSAAVFYRGAFGSLRARALHMDVPITVGILAGAIGGAVNTVRGAGEVYFDSVTVLILLLLAGRWLQRRQQRKAADASELLFSMAPNVARVLEPDGLIRERPVQAVVRGARVEVRAGESVPVDGTLEDGHATVDAAVLTGESRPREVDAGEPLHAGTVNLGGRIVVRVEGAGENTRIGRLLRLVEEHARRKAPVVRMADRVSAWFVAAVLLLAAVTLAAWWATDPARALDHAVALLVVTCPCALGLATPLAVAAAIGKAGKAGILIKGGDVLERLAKPGAVLLDKTGTLTEGRTRVVRWSGEDAVRGAVAALERQVSHPVATAFVEAFGDLPAPADVVLHDAQGGGLAGSVDGRAMLVGSPAFVRARLGGLPGNVEAAVASAVAEALTPIVVARDGQAAGVAALGDPLRADSEATVRRLERRGFEVVVLSGDHPEVVRAVAEQLEIPPGNASGGLLPEDKLERVRVAAAADRPVVMVGDGVNDAAALAAAPVGVAVHGGAEAAMGAADVFLTEQGLAPLDRLLEGSARTFRVIRANLWFSLAYNVAGAGLAMAGLIHPIVAAILMPLSSLTVVTNAYRSRTF